MGEQCISPEKLRKILASNKLAKASREICKICFHVNTIGFHVPDDVWNVVVPEYLQPSVVCLACFTRLADEKLVAWDRKIEFFPVSLAKHLDVE